MSDTRTYKFRTVGELVQALDQAAIEGRSDRHVFDYTVFINDYVANPSRTLVVNHDQREVRLEGTYQ